MSGSIVTWTTEDLRTLHRMRMDWQRWRKLEGPKRGVLEDPETYQGAFIAKVVDGTDTTGLPAAESLLKPGRGRIRLRQLWFRDDDLSSEDMDIDGPTERPHLFRENLDTNNEFDCYNISTSQEWIEGDIILVMPLAAGRFVAVSSGGGGNIIHCRVTECLGDGYYKGTIGERPSFTIPTVGTGSGSASDCDPCSLLSGGNGLGTGTAYEAAACSSLGQPSRVTPASGDREVYLYDLRGLPILVPGHAMIEDCGDKVVDPAYAGAGTGSTDNQVVLYIVLSANYELVGIPDRFYECCEGPPQQVVMVRCDTYVVEGVYCPGVDAGCPPVGTGS